MEHLLFHRFPNSIFFTSFYFHYFFLSFSIILQPRLFFLTINLEKSYISYDQSSLKLILNNELNQIYMKMFYSIYSSISMYSHMDSSMCSWASDLEIWVIQGTLTWCTPPIQIKVWNQTFQNDKWGNSSETQCRSNFLW